VLHILETYFSWTEDLWMMIICSSFHCRQQCQLLEDKLQLS